MASRLSPIDLFNTLTPQEQQQLLAKLRRAQPKPCEKSGHKYKLIGSRMRWLLPPQDKFICTACGKVLLI